jgi:3'(2'), 5'-bisphosphate nucleotidase
MVQQTLENVIKIAQEAGQEILKIYNTADFNVDMKADNSPLTQADIASHEHIVARLTALTPDIPILSEESKDISYQERKTWSRFWLVDPLDGTKEFIKRNGEFTVNIALVENGLAILGVVHVPVLDLTYYAAKDVGAFKVQKGQAQAIKAKGLSSKQISVVASRSHAGPETEAFLANLAKDYQVNLASKGSALKICMVAEGEANLYPRLGPTMEWDTAAAQCVAEQAGALVTNIQNEPLHYNKENLLNPFFVINTNVDWQSYLLASV